jgi:hypothetical protein
MPTNRLTMAVESSPETSCAYSVWNTFELASPSTLFTDKNIVTYKGSIAVNYDSSHIELLLNELRISREWNLHADRT